MAYSQDYRQMILEKLNSGYSYRELAAEYGISRSTIQLWKKCIERKPYPKRTNKINDELLRKDVEQFPDDFQRERAVRFNCSQRAIGVALKRLKITQKKILKHPKAQPEKIEQFLSLKQQYEQDKRPIVYIDESGFKKQTYRPYAYAPRGQVCHGNHNWQIKNTSNAIGALYQNQLIAVGGGVLKSVLFKIS